MSLLSINSNEGFIEAWTKEVRGSANQTVEMEVDQTQWGSIFMP